MMLKLVPGCGGVCRPCISNKERKCIGSVRDHGLLTPKEEWNGTLDIYLLERSG